MLKLRDYHNLHTKNMLSTNPSIKWPSPHHITLHKIQLHNCLNVYRSLNLINAKKTSKSNFITIEDKLCNY